MTEPKHKANNGERRDAILHNYRGPVGVQTIRSRMYISYRPENSSDIGNACQIEGQPYKILNSERSASVPGFLVVEVERIDA